MKLTKAQLRKIIRETVVNNSYDLKSVTATPISEPDLEDVEALEDSWAGGNNIQQQIDHSKAAKSEPVTRGAETLNIVEENVSGPSTSHGIFSEDYIYDALADDIIDFLQLTRGTVNYMTEKETQRFKMVAYSAIDKLVEDYGEVI